MLNLSPDLSHHTEPENPDIIAVYSSGQKICKRASEDIIDKVGTREDEDEEVTTKTKTTTPRWNRRGKDGGEEDGVYRAEWSEGE